ncbi:MAG: metallophosphoesterase [Clostridia bacterium]|nr:metallophosphoesterase [Clostridia bacterium]
MIYYTGDIHGQPHKIVNFCDKYSLTEEDVIVILGDVGANYYGDERDNRLKKALAKLPPTIFCIHGNHERRPYTVYGYKEIEWHGGMVWQQEQYPRLLFANDGDIYDLDGRSTIVIGGAYSVDKYYRLARGISWFSDEQPSEDTKRKIENVLAERNWTIDQVLSHTCPIKYTPTEAFMPSVNQALVDKTTEEWLDSIEDKLTYNRWFCGHWHIDKTIDGLYFLMDGFIT